MGVQSLTYNGIESITEKSITTLQKNAKDKYYSKYYLMGCKDIDESQNRKEYLFLKYISPLKCELSEYFDNIIKEKNKTYTEQYYKRRVVFWECEDIRTQEDVDCCEWDAIEW